jgi:hypothetical protein
MKKIILLLFIAAILFNCNKNDNLKQHDNAEKTSVTQNTVSEKDPQVKNEPEKLLSTYSEQPGKYAEWNRRVITYVTDTEIISKKKLLSTVWKKSMLSVLVFYSDNRFAYGGYQCGKIIKGDYEIINDKQLKLIADKEYFSPYEGFDKPQIVLDFITNQKNLEYSHFFQYNNTVFYAAESEPAEGDEVLFNNYYIVKKTKEVISTDNINLRRAPLLSAEKIDISDFSTFQKITNGVLQKGETVTQLGFIKKVETINDVSGNWLLIEIPCAEENMGMGFRLKCWAFSPYFIDSRAGE